jgi:hypothetical protein
MRGRKGGIVSQGGELSVGCILVFIFINYISRIEAIHGYRIANKKAILTEGNRNAN